jgi:hypothetical protein
MYRAQLGVCTDDIMLQYFTMSIDYDISNTEVVSISVKGTVNMESVATFCALYRDILTAIHRTSHKRHLHVIISDGTIFTGNTLLSLYSFVHYKCKTLNKNTLHSIVLFTDNDRMRGALNRLSAIMTPAIPLTVKRTPPDAVLSTSVPA